MGFDPENDGRLLESFFEDCFSSGIATDGIVAQDSKQRSQIWGGENLKKLQPNWKHVSNVIKRRSSQLENHAGLLSTLQTGEAPPRTRLRTFILITTNTSFFARRRSWKYDLSAPLSHWASLTDSVQNKIGDKGSCVIWGHLGDRNIHLNIVSDLDEDLGELIEVRYFSSVTHARMHVTCTQHALTHFFQPDIYHETMAVSGSISAEHGVGIAKAKYLKDAVGESVQGAKRRAQVGMYVISTSLALPLIT